MILGIMQPYFLPYLGYFQLINYCDVFVLYDDIKYSKRGWINRNRLQLKNEIRTFTLPLERDKDYLYVRDRKIAKNYDARKLMKLFREAYGRSPNWHAVEGLLSTIVFCPDRNLFDFIYHSVEALCRFMSISTPLVVSSQVGIRQDLKGQDRVLATCRTLNASKYVNPIGGTTLYDKGVFRERGLELNFLESTFAHRSQRGAAGIENLSIVDALANLPLSELQLSLATDFRLIEG